ncbi:MAG: hypothetical protein QOE36_3257, partial [Gaiellaceae bacterium]|nr:hypothetical protein [Gaiellaceae bacterium]
LGLVPEHDTEHRRAIARKQGLAAAALAHVGDVRLARRPDREPSDV